MSLPREMTHEDTWIDAGKSAMNAEEGWRARGRDAIMERDDGSDAVSDAIADHHEVFDRCSPEGRRQVRQVVATFRDEMVDAPNAPLGLLDTAVADIEVRLATLVEAHIEVENGRDPLTRLRSRRFVSIVLGREIALSRAESQGRDRVEFG